MTLSQRETISAVFLRLDSATASDVALFSAGRLDLEMCVAERGRIFPCTQSILCAD